ncbi:hypothetical protein T492DRAFT_1134170 [Pavlovales sp. CCMP2436]|nr:hypothetical protein T492DRAFT_1134170 [Pavlovales sp. CCMP2436]
MTPFRPLFGPPQPIDLIRSQQGSSSSQRQSQQPPPLAFIPTTLAGPSTVPSTVPSSAPTSAATKGPPSPSTPPVSYETGTSRGSGSRPARPAGVNKKGVMARNSQTKPGFYARTVKLDVFITGSNGVVPRHVVFDISQTVEDYRTSIKRKFTMIIKHSNEVTFFSNETEVVRDTEAGPACLWWFICIRIVHRRNYPVNGTTMNVVNSIERIKNSLYTLQEKINIVSCTATSDSWLITTDNPSGDVQLNVVPAYSTEDIEVFIKNSPLFVNNINISTSNDWNNSDGWRVVSSSTYQNNASYAANAAFDKNSGTYWGSADGTFTTAGVGSQYLTIEYPQALKISSLRFEGSTRYPGVTAPTAWTLSGSNDTTFTDIQSYEKTNWSSNIAAAFDVTTDHIPYRFYRVTFTRVTAGSGSTYVSVPDITFITVHPVGAHLLSVYPVSTNTFKIIMGNAEGRIMSMIDSPMADWKFFITILKGGRIANTGMYTLSSTGFTKTS